MGNCALQANKHRSWPNAYVLLAQGYYQTKDYNKALFNVEKAISMHKEKQAKRMAEDPTYQPAPPKENWYNLARFLYFEKNDIPKSNTAVRCCPVLRMLGVTGLFIEHLLAVC